MEQVFPQQEVFAFQEKRYDEFLRVLEAEEGAFAMAFHIHSIYQLVAKYRLTPNDLTSLRRSNDLYKSPQASL